MEETVAGQKVSRNIHQTKKFVREVLESDVKSKDSDERLVSIFWNNQLKRKKYSPDVMSTVEFLKLYAKNELTPAELIVRARRSLQEKHPELRGEKWSLRHNKEQEVRENISHV